MAKKILSALTAPLAVALYALSLLAAGIGGGVLLAQKMIAAEEKHRAEAKAAAAAALLPKPPPERMRDDARGPSPFEPRYVNLGDEILSALETRGRAILVDISLMTMRGDKAEALLNERRMPLRALAVAIISEMTVGKAKAAGAADQLAQRLRIAFNEALRQETGVEPVDHVVIKRFFVQ